MFFKRGNVLVILLVVVLVVSAGLTGYFFWSSKSKGTLFPISTPGNELAPEVANKILLLPDPTANWKIYTNNNLGVEFKFPSNWKSFESSTSLMSFSDNDEVGLTMFEGIFANFTEGNYSYCDLPKLFSTKTNVPARYGSCKQDSVQNIQNYQVLFFSFTPSKEAQTETVFIKGFAVKSADKTYVLDMASFHEEKLSSETLFQILSTFKFL